MKGWYDSSARGDIRNISLATGRGQGANANVTVSELDQVEGFFGVKGTITSLLLDTCMYKSCPTDGCKKKVKIANEIEKKKQNYHFFNADVKFIVFFIGG